MLSAIRIQLKVFFTQKIQEESVQHTITNGHIAFRTYYAQVKSGSISDKFLRYQISTIFEAQNRIYATQYCINRTRNPK